MLAYPFLNLDVRTGREVAHTGDDHVYDVLDLWQVIVVPSLGELGSPETEDLDSSLQVYLDGICSQV